MVKGFVDAVYLDAQQGVLAIDGWVVPPATDPVEALKPRCGRFELPTIQARLGLPSPDVAAAFPQLAGAHNARFSMTARVDESMSRRLAREPVDVIPVIRGHAHEPLAGRSLGPAPVSEKWFRDHYDSAASQVIDFLAAESIRLAGRRIADVGCGDGITDLGLMHKARPAEFVCFDIVPTDTQRLREMARACGASAEIPPALVFRGCGERALPAPDGTFDVVFSWSAFEHIADPVSVLSEIRRVIRPDGTFMLQLWPFFHSQHGSHLWDWFPDGFAHLLLQPAELEAAVHRTPGPPGPGEAERMLGAFRTLNRITLDDLHRALLRTGWMVTKLELITEPVRIPAPLAHLSLPLLTISGVKLLARPATA